MLRARTHIPQHHPDAEHVAGGLQELALPQLRGPEEGVLLLLQAAGQVKQIKVEAVVHPCGQPEVNHTGAGGRA